ncbi:MAG: hypothetical protein C0594_02885, partial [Marinilabiliales bacterium]
MKKLKILFILSFYSIFAFPCEHTLSLYDTYGDGWNGNTVDVIVDGVTVLSGITFSSGSGPEAFTFDADDGAYVQVIYNGIGSYTSENEITIFDLYGNIIAEDGMNGLTPNGITFTATCPEPTCDDGIWNGDEEFTDCGGPDCDPCTQCANGVQDADEEGIDCGGANCPACPTDWNIDNVANQTISTCTGILYDSGGPSGDYASSEDYTVTFCSSNGGPIIANVSYSGESCCDHLYIHDGSSTAGTQLADIVGSANQMYISSGTCITFHWDSDGSVVGAGFAISLNCDMNYDPCNAWTLSPGMECTYMQATNLNASSSSVADPPCGNYNGQDVWFQVTVPSSGIITVDTDMGDLTDMAMALYSGTNCNGLTMIDCDENSSNNPNMPWISADNLVPGSTIWIRVWDENGDAEGSFNICVIDNAGPPQCDTGSPMADDDCSNATPICSFNGYCGNTSDAYTSADVPSGFCGSVENNSWLSFVAAEPEVTLNVWTSNCTSGDGIQMEIYHTSDCSNFTSVSNCVSDGVMSDFSITTDVPLTVGETYLLMIDGWGGDVCDYVIQAAEGVLVATAISLDTGTDMVGICSGGSTQLQASGGTSYQWTPATDLDDPTSATPIATPTTTTTYTVSVTGGNDDCPSSATAEVTVYVTEGFTITSGSTDVTCYSDTDGEAHVEAFNGVEPYSYNWSTGATDSLITSLAPGTYTVTVSDTTGCVLSDSLVINEPDSIMLSLSATETITGIAVGEANIDNITNGTGPYTIEWSDGQTDYTASQLAEANYCVTVTDVNGCTGSDCIDVPSVGNPTADFSYNGDQCFDGHSFDFTNMGTPPGPAISYSWVFSGATPDTSTQENPTGITWPAPGIYDVTQTITQGGLTSDTTIQIEVFIEPQITVIGTDPLCYNGNDGYAEIIHDTGTSPYTYLWDAAAGSQ